MEDRRELQVKTISIETIKPSSPTPSHRKTCTLPLIDQIRDHYHSVLVLFYPKTTSIELNIDVLKTSLSETLSEYYPFAGRLKDDFTVSCNDQGIAFSQTHINHTLSDFLNSPNKIDSIHKLTPTREYKAEKTLSKIVPLAFQINVFSCGGVVIGCFKSHKLLLDGTSLVAFLKHWAATSSSASGRNRDVNYVPVTPDFESALLAFPSQPMLGWTPFRMTNDQTQAMMQLYKNVHVVAKSFVFSKDAINELKSKATSEKVSRPSRVETLAGFVWEQCIAAAYTAGAMPEGPEPSVISLVTNMRSRLNPPLTSTSMGNLIVNSTARAKAITGLSKLVEEIHESLSDISDRIELYKGGQNIDALVKDIAPARYFPGAYVLTSWIQFALDKINFGFGKPNWASPTDGIISPFFRNVIYFFADTNGDGIEVWLYLEEKEMQILEANEEFLAFASPN